MQRLAIVRVRRTAELVCADPRLTVAPAHRLPRRVWPVRFRLLPPDSPCEFLRESDPSGPPGGDTFPDVQSDSAWQTRQRRETTRRSRDRSSPGAPASPPAAPTAFWRVRD